MDPTESEELLDRVVRDRWGRVRRCLRWLVLIGWLLITLGVFGDFISHKSAALGLSGSDLGEFVKFLPAVRDGSVRVHRLLFYLPSVAMVLGISLLCHSRHLGIAPWARIPPLLFGAVVSLQLLPPAWSPESLRTDEFLAQAIALLACWLLLVFSRLLGRLPLTLAGSLACLSALAAGSLSQWQVRLVLPHVAAAYGESVAVGWGFWAAGVGLAAAGLSSAAAAFSAAKCKSPV